MRKRIRQLVINELWQTYRQTTPHIQAVCEALKQKNIVDFPQDHLAIIDLPSNKSGIPSLKKLFEAIGFSARGQGYLPEKQNDFLWLAEEDSDASLAIDALPQVVVADFRLEEMPHAVSVIIKKYAALTTPLPDSFFQMAEDISAENTPTLVALILNYLKGRDWPLPTRHEFKTVQQFNELLAWVLVFGRRPNHFTLSVHLLPHFTSLADFNDFITDEVKLALNTEGGIVKGGKCAGIAQSSTIGAKDTVLLANGEVSLPTGFVEFVFRFPAEAHIHEPPRFTDFFTGFIAHHANHVIESLHVNNQSKTLLATSCTDE